MKKEFYKIQKRENKIIESLSFGGGINSQESYAGRLRSDLLHLDDRVGYLLGYKVTVKITDHIEN